MDSFYVTQETAHELIVNHGFQFTASERRITNYIDRIFISSFYQVNMRSKRIMRFLVSEVPFIELNTSQVLELMFLPTAESRHIIINSNWNMFADAMHSAKLLNDAVCSAH